MLVFVFHRGWIFLSTQIFVIPLEFVLLFSSTSTSSSPFSRSPRWRRICPLRCRWRWSIRAEMNLHFSGVSLIPLRSSFLRCFCRMSRRWTILRVFISSIFTMLISLLSTMFLFISKFVPCRSICRICWSLDSIFHRCWTVLHDRSMVRLSSVHPVRERHFFLSLFDEVDV